jgi:predicted nucleotidyltransferase
MVICWVPSRGSLQSLGDLPAGRTAVGKFSTHLWKRLLEERQKDKERKRVETLESVCKSLREYFSPKKVQAVYLCGSITREGEFDSFSDIDVAVEGLEEDYFATLCELEELLKRNVDLIELRKCSFREGILKEGVRVL